MEMPVKSKDETFTLQVLSHSVGSNGVLSFSDLPINTTVAQLKTKIKERVSHVNAGEHYQRLIHRGRILVRTDETMVDLFGADTLKNFPTQSLHLSITPRTDEKQDESTALTSAIPIPADLGHPQIPQSAAAAAPPALYPNAFPRRELPNILLSSQADQMRSEEQNLDQVNQANAISEAARAYATQRLNINSLHHANNHAVDASIHLQNMQAHGAPLSIRETARTGLQVALENQYQAWQRAYLTSTQNERQILSQPYWTAADETLRHAIRMGIEYLEAEDRLASSQPYLEQPGQDSAIAQRDQALQRYQWAVGHANVAIGLPPGNSPRLTPPEQRIVRDTRARRRAAAAAAGAAVGAEPLPVLGHGPNVRPLAAGLLAALVPHLWILFKLAIFICAFTRIDDSWQQIFMISMVAFGILLYNIGALEGVWTGLLGHLHGLVPMAELPQPVRIENGAIVPRANAAGSNAGNAAQPEGLGRRRAAEPTPEQYAERLLAHQHQARNRTQANRSWLKDTFRMAERDVLLFFLSIVPGVAERHIAAMRSENRARERDREREETAWEDQEARDDLDVEQREGREGAVGAAAVEGAGQDAEERRLGGGQRLGDGEHEQPRAAAVEDDVFGGVD